MTYRERLQSTTTDIADALLPEKVSQVSDIQICANRMLLITSEMISTGKGFDDESYEVNKENDL